MSDKTTAWTTEELSEFAKQRARRDVDAYERDERGHPIPFRPFRADRRRWEGHICPEYEHCQLCVEEAADGAAAVAFGLLGMGWAIRANHPRVPETCGVCGGAGETLEYLDGPNHPGMETCSVCNGAGVW